MDHNLITCYNAYFCFRKWQHSEQDKRNDKAVPEFAKKACGEEGLVPRVMNLCSRWKCVVSFMPRPLYPPTAETGTHWMGGRMATEPVQAFWRRKKSRTPANQITIPRSSNTPSFRTSTEIFFFLILTFFYLLIVGILGYFGSWLLSMTHTYTHTHTR